MNKTMVRVACFVLSIGLADIAFAQPQGERSSDQPPRDEAAPRRESRRDDEPPPPPPKQKNKELFDRDFPGPRDGRPGGDKNGPPKGKSGPGDRRPGEESPYEMNIRVTSEAVIRSHDRNGDGQLDRSEWTHIRDAEKFDTDHDGVITLKELIDGPQGPRPFFADPRNMSPGPNGEMPGYGGFGGGRVFGGRPGAMPGPGGVPGMPGMSGPFGEGPGDDPEMRDLLRQDTEMDHKTHELSIRVRESRGEDRNKIKAELSELVNKHFDVRQKRRELQLKRMEDELQRLREAISTRNKSRESIVTNHIKELIGEERDLEF
jgi:hypothetical protein